MLERPEAVIRARLGIGFARRLLHGALATGEWNAADATAASFVTMALRAE